MLWDKGLYSTPRHKLTAHLDVLERAMLRAVRMSTGAQLGGVHRPSRKAGSCQPCIMTTRCSLSKFITETCSSRQPEGLGLLTCNQNPDAGQLAADHAAHKHCDGHVQHCICTTAGHQAEIVVICTAAPFSARWLKQGCWYRWSRAPASMPTPWYTSIASIHRKRTWIIHTMLVGYMVRQAY